MPAITTPGTYIGELPGGPPTIAGAATSVTAFLGQASRGPVNLPTVVESFQAFENIFGGLWAGAALGFALNDYFVNGGLQAVILRLAPADVSTASLALGAPSLNLGQAASAFTLTANSPGAWGNNLAVSITPEPGSTSAEAVFNLVVQLTGPANGQVQQEEQYLNVSTDPGSAQYLPALLAKSSQLIAAIHEGQPAARLPVPVKPVIPLPVLPRPVDSGPIIPRPVIPQPIMPHPPTPPQSPAANLVPLTGGADGTAAISDNQIIGSAASNSGLYALEQSGSVFNLLCIPPCNASGGLFLDLSLAVQTAAAACCAGSRAMYIMDSPAAWTSAATASSGLPAVTAAIGANSDRVALYFPRLIESDPLNPGQTLNLVSCGAVAGVYANNGALDGVWKSPAGEKAGLAGVQQLSVSVDDADNGQLNNLGINCIRIFPGTGALIWGARTLAGGDSSASQWTYVSVRRLALFLEQSLEQGLKWVVFEPNAEPLWAQIRLAVAAFMQTLFTQGAFAGTTPQSAYFVKCDSETTTQSDIDQGVVNIQVGFAPQTPAEFVIISIQQLANQPPS
jgi:phage tail sheath protein FI